MSRRVFDLFYRLDPGELEGAGFDAADERGDRWVPLSTVVSNTERFCEVFGRRWARVDDRNWVPFDYRARLDDGTGWRPFHAYLPTEEGRRSWWSAVWAAAALDGPTPQEALARVSSFDQHWHLDSGDVIKTDRGLPRSADDALRWFVKRGARGPDDPLLTPAMKDRLRTEVMAQLQHTSRRFDAAGLKQEIEEATQDALALHLHLFCKHHAALERRLYRGREALHEELECSFLPLPAELILGLQVTDATDEQVVSEVRRRHPGFVGLPEMKRRTLVEQRAPPIGFAGSPALVSGSLAGRSCGYIHPVESLRADLWKVEVEASSHPPIALVGDPSMRLEPFPLDETWHLYERWYGVVAEVERYRWGPAEDPSSDTMPSVAHSLLRQCATLRDGWLDDPVLTSVDPTSEDFLDELDTALFRPPYSTVAAHYKQEVLGLIFGKLDPADFVVFESTHEHRHFCNEWYDYLWVLLHPQQRVALVIVSTATD